MWQTQACSIYRACSIFACWTFRVRQLAMTVGYVFSWQTSTMQIRALSYCMSKSHAFLVADVKLSVCSTLQEESTILFIWSWHSTVVGLKSLTRMTALRHLVIEGAVMTEHGILKYLLPLAEFRCLSELVVGPDMASSLSLRHKFSALFCKIQCMKFIYPMYGCDYYEYYETGWAIHHVSSL